MTSNAYIASDGSNVMKVEKQMMCGGVFLPLSLSVLRMGKGGWGDRGKPGIPLFSDARS